jgi:hypothetical protein
LGLLGIFACGDIADDPESPDRHPCGIRFHQTLGLQPTEDPILYHYAELDMVGMIGIGTGTACDLLLNPWPVFGAHAGEQQVEGCGLGRIDLEQFARSLRPDRAAGEVELPVTQARRLFREAQALFSRPQILLCLESLPGLREETGYRLKPSDFIIGEALAFRRGNRERTKQSTIGRLKRVAGIGRSTEFADEAAVLIGRDALLVGHKRLAACRRGPAIFLTEFERPSSFEAVKWYAVGEHQSEALRRGIETVVDANNGVESRADALERHAGEFAQLGNADQVRGGLEQRGRSLGVLALVVGGFTAERVELNDRSHHAPWVPFGTRRLSTHTAYIRTRSHRLQTGG